jgi:hypothetical protein
VPAYARYTVGEFLTADAATVIGTLETRHAHDGFATQYTQQTKAWEQFIPLLRAELQSFLAECPDSIQWGVLLEYPLYRLRKRIDAVILAGSTIIVVETKIGVTGFQSADARQVEDYALDLRDFHAGSRGRLLIPMLWCTAAPAQQEVSAPTEDPVGPVHRIGSNELGLVLRRFASSAPNVQLDPAEWDAAPYRPVPTIIQAATSIFAGHDVRAIGQADATNLAVAATRIVGIISDAKANSRKVIVFLTGVPGAGKTLAGLEVVHDAIASGAEGQGDIIYLSGNTPLVTVIREALARDRVHQAAARNLPTTLREERRLVRTRIQHINDFLKQYLKGADTVLPHEHAIVFDEAQRAWDAAQGAKKFDRKQSEPSLLLQIMGRHPNWCACICLVGGGQEINSGEEGMKGWGDAIRQMGEEELQKWLVYGPVDVFQGSASTGGFSLGELPSGIKIIVEPDLRLSVPLRTYRSPATSDWVAALLAGDLAQAKVLASQLGEYPIVVTRSLERAKFWLRDKGRGHRRFGLLASSGARRLRADGLGEFLKATDGLAIAQWYLNNPDDIRSSYFLEVPANEYACQGLEIDFACVCWGGDLIYSRDKTGWVYRQLSGNDWNEARADLARRYVQNSYRVLLTRAREGMVVWVPKGDAGDHTRQPEELDATAELLLAAGANLVDQLP